MPLFAKDLGGETLCVEIIRATTTVAYLKAQVKARMVDRGREPPQDVRLLAAGAVFEPDNALARATPAGQTLGPEGIIHILPARHVTR